MKSMKQLSLNLGRSELIANSKITFVLNHVDDCQEVLKICPMYQKKQLFVQLKFLIKEGQEMFSLGELSGSIKSAIQLVNFTWGSEKIIPYHKITLEANNTLFVVTMLVDGTEIPEVLQDIGIDGASIDILCDQKLPEFEENRTIDEISELILAGIDILEPDGESFPIRIEAKASVQRDPLLEFVNQEVYSPEMALFLKFVTNAHFDCPIENLTELKEMLSKYDIPVVICDFQSLRVWLISILVEYISIESEGTHKVIQSLYTTLNEHLQGIDSISVFQDNYQLTAKTSNCNLFNGYLPSLDDLESVKDTFPKLTGTSFQHLHFGKTEKRVLLLGLNDSGKTTLLYQYKLGETVTSIPTIGFNVETVEHNSCLLTIWDVGGHSKIRMLWRHYFSGTQGLIWVVDASDIERIEESREELERLLSEDELINIPIMILVNKCDLPNARPLAQVAEDLQLYKLRERQWFIQSTCAVTGEGIKEGLDWFCTAMMK